jgi:hypothetical protein
VDGGNTKTIALVARTNGAISGVGRSRCSDIYGASSPEVAIAMALSGAGIQKEALSASCLSMAGLIGMMILSFFSIRSQAMVKHLQSSMMRWVH